MPDTTTTPNMGLPVPVPSTAPGPAWATSVTADMYAIDSHNHSAGQGVQITPDGMDISSDLDFGGNNATGLRSSRYTAQAAPLALGSDLDCVYVSGVDLYFNDGNGNHVRITQSGSVTGATGTITGLPSGTASASYSAGTFTFQAATNTPATMAVGPLVIGRAVASSYTCTLTPSASQTGNIAMTLPAAVPSANQTLVFDGSGNMAGSYGLIPIGSVIATFPDTTGAYRCTATTAADSRGFVKCGGQTIVDATSPMNGQVVPNINGNAFVRGDNISGTTGGAATVTLTGTELPAHTHAAGTYATSIGVTGGTASLTGTTTFAGSAHTHDMSHWHQWGNVTTGAFTVLYGLPTGAVSPTTINSSNTAIITSNTAVTAGASTGLLGFASTGNFYTTGVVGGPVGSGGSANTGTPSTTASVGISSTAASATGSNTVTGNSASTGAGSSFSILPTYITALYIMRIV